MSGAAGTISIPFVYLKARGTNSIPTKKAQLPSNLRTLFKICNRLFQKYGEVKTIYNSDGTVIKDISDVPPGSTLYVSNREANENDTLASRQGIFALGRPPESSPNDKENRNLDIENNDSFNALFGNKDGHKSGKGVFRSRDQQLQNESLRHNQEKQNQINQSLERQKKKQEDKKKQQEAEKQRLLDEKRRQQEEEERRRRQQQEEEERRRRHQEEEEEEERRRRKQQEEEEERKKMQSQQDIDYDYDEQDKLTSDYSRRTSNSPRNSEKYSPRSSVKDSPRNSVRDSQRNSVRDSPRSSIRNRDMNSDISADSTFDPQMFLELFSKMLDNEDLNDDMGSELTYSEQWMRRFLGLAPQFEKEQMSNWYAGLYDVFSQIGLPVSFLDKPNRKSNKYNKGERENDVDGKNEFEADSTNRNQNGFYIEEPELFGKNEILKFVRDTIIRHRFISSQNCVDYSFNIAIVGPRNSGKSNLLSCFASEIMKELCVTDNWRQFFLFPINFKVFAPFYEDLSALYATMVDMVVSYLCWQAPFYSQHASAIKRLFMSSINVQLVGASSSSSATKSQRKSQANPVTNPVPSMFAKSRAPPVVPKNSLFYRDVPRFALALQKAAQEIFNVWNEPGSLSEFLSLVYSLPSIVSKAAGFSKVLFFIDNIEFADVEVVPSKPFAQSDNPVIYNIEIVQYVLSSQHFVVTGEEQKRIFESLSPVEEKYIDLENRIDFVSTIGIIPIDENDNRLIKTEIQDEPLPFSFSIEACCGIPAFLQMWVELNDEFDEFEDNDQNEEDSEEKEEGRMLLITHAQQVIDVLFTFDDKSPLFVTNVKRSPKEAEQQSHS